MAHEHKLSYIADSAIGNNCIFLVPDEFQKEYMEAFDFHSGRFFGLKILADEGKADVYSPIGEIVGEIPVQTSNE